MKLAPKPARLLFAFLLLTLWIVTARAGDEWKPLNPNDLAAKAPVVEKDADAEALFWEVRVDDSSTDGLALKHYVRVKIFTERGKEKYSKFEIPFLKGMKVKDVAARVIKPDGSIVELKKEDIFERTVIKVSGLKLKVKSFAVPGIEPGVIVEYRYRETIDEGDANMRLILQRDIPIQNVSYYVRPFSGQLGMKYQSFNIPGDTKFVKDKDGYHRLTMTNVPALRDEPRMVPEDEVRSWVRIYYTNDTESTSTAYWERLGPRLHEVFKDSIKPNDDVKKTTQEVAAGASTPDDKLARIYEFCQTQIKNISFDFALPDEERKKIKNKSPGDTLKRRAGDSADVDMLFAAMAAAAGFDSRVAFTADRSEMFFNPNMAGINFLHPACIAVSVEGKWRFYNPGTLYLPLGMLVWNEEGQYALVGDKKLTWSNTPISGPEQSKAKRTGKFRLLEDGTLEGDVRIEYTGQMAYSRRTANDEDSPAQREATIRDEAKNRISTAELTEVKMENVQTSKGPLVYSYKVNVPGYAQRTGKRLFLQPNFFEYNTKPIFTSSERKYDIYFNYPWSEDDNISIELPAGYALDSPDVPAPLQIANICEAVVKMALAKNDKTQTLTYQRKFFFGVTQDLLVFKAERYNGVKVLFDAINKTDTHTITLKQGATP